MDNPERHDATAEIVGWHVVCNVCGPLSEVYDSPSPAWAQAKAHQGSGGDGGSDG